MCGACWFVSNVCSCRTQTNSLWPVVSGRGIGLCPSACESVLPDTSSAALPPNTHTLAPTSSPIPRISPRKVGTQGPLILIPFSRTFTLNPTSNSGRSYCPHATGQSHASQRCFAAVGRQMLKQARRGLQPEGTCHKDRAEGACMDTKRQSSHRLSPSPS